MGDAYKLYTAAIFLGIMILAYFSFPVSIFATDNTKLFFLTVIYLSFILVLIAQTDDGRVRTIPYMLSFCISFMVLGFRYYTGIDDPHYEDIFYGVSTRGLWGQFNETHMELGYLCINKIVSLFTKDYLYCQLTTSFLFLSLMYRGFYKYRNRIFIPVALVLMYGLIYFQVMSTGMVRMSIAMGLVFCFAFEYLFNYELKKYIISVFIISMFHYSALCMLIFTPFAISPRYTNEKLKGTLLKITFGAVPAFFLVSYLASLMGGRWEKYGNANEEFELGIDLFDTLPFIIMALFFRRTIRPDDEDMYKHSVIILYVSLLFSILKAIAPVGRVIFYTNMSLWFIFPILCYSRSKSKPAIIAIGLLYAILYLFVTQFRVEHRSFQIFPFVNYFFNV